MTAQDYSAWDAAKLRAEMRVRGLFSGMALNRIGNAKLREILTAHDEGRPWEEILQAALKAADEKFPSPFQGEAAPSNGAAPASDEKPQETAPTPMPQQSAAVRPSASSGASGAPATGRPEVTPAHMEKLKSDAVCQAMLTGLNAAVGFDVLKAIEFPAVIVKEVVKEVPVPAKPAWSLPASDDDSWYIRPTYWDFVNKLLDFGWNVCLVGPSGCGKTTFWEQVAKYRRKKFFQNDCGIETSAAAIVGGTRIIPNPNGEGTVTAFKPGTLVQAMEYDPDSDPENADRQWDGALYRLGEMDFINPGVAGLLHGVLEVKRDRIRRINIPDAGRRIQSRPGFTLVGDANTTGRCADRRFGGTQRQNEAFINRWKLVKVSYENEGKILTKYGVKAADAQKMVRFAKKLRTKIDECGVPFSYTTRDLEDAAQMFLGGFDLTASLALPFHKLEVGEIAKLGGKDGSPDSLVKELLPGEGS